ncbi:hypothetical protein Forpi1262_v011145 [Fusarium oxysporum f. sp. raphani]|uniref:Uncharacterized protein n=1 Tax=Fusarium oxysporum f. sp. raphani TaxID=96318 RepID=A0A8J5PQS6_FUSOX|nr:hypothetical protein Forpi1262_v011145 [Fusarium oxysporum f. sp. raphani]KAK2692213.1 hypothetical protein QWA68_008210 [Fusarium oxysporum]
MANIDENMSEELAVLQDGLLELHNSLLTIRFEIAKASAKARGLLQCVADILKRLDTDELYSPDAPVTPTCPSLPWRDYSTDFKDNADVQEGNSKEKTQG